MTLTALTSEHGLTHLATLADVLKGCTDVQRGDGKRGIESIKKDSRIGEASVQSLRVPGFSESWRRD